MCEHCAKMENLTNERLKEISEFADNIAEMFTDGVVAIELASTAWNTEMFRDISQIAEMVSTMKDMEAAMKDVVLKRAMIMDADLNEGH